MGTQPTTFEVTREWQVAFTGPTADFLFIEVVDTRENTGDEQIEFFIGSVTPTEDHYHQLRTAESKGRSITLDAGESLYVRTDSKVARLAITGA